MLTLLPLLLSASLSHAATLYLSPPTISQGSTSILTPVKASLLLSAHFGFDTSDTLGDDDNEHRNYLGTIEKAFVGVGARKGLFVGVDEEFVADLMPSNLAFVRKIDPEPSLDSLSSMVKSLEDRAGVPHSNVDETDAEPTRQASSELSSISDFLLQESSSTFTAVNLRGFVNLAGKYGRHSDIYYDAAQKLKAALTQAVEGSDIDLAIVALPSRTILQRAQSAASINSYGSCFSSADVCSNSTGGCSGHGDCVKQSKAGQTCYQCQCKTVKTGGKTKAWVGERCEKEDISGPFVLITGTVIGLIILIGGSIGLISTIGSEELPSVLAGGGVKKD